MENVGNRNPKSICVMIGDADVSHDFSAELLKGIFDTADKEGVRLLYLLGMPRHAEPTEQGSKGKSAYHYNSIYDYAYLFGTDAYILSCSSLSGFKNQHTFRKFLKNIGPHPYVVLQENIETDAPGKTCVTVDNYGSVRECAEHLIDVHGYRKIAFLAGIKEHPETKERLLAYTDTMEKNGYPVSDSLIAYGDFSEYSDEQALQLIRGNPGLEAIMCCNDEMAIGCYRVCAQLGLRVGRDIAITGFDNFSAGRSMIPQLTTVSQNIYQMGETAVLQAIALTEGKQIDPVKLKTKFHIRRSCGCHAGAVRSLFQSDSMDNGLSEVLRKISEDLLSAYADSERAQNGIIIVKFTDYIKTLLLENPSRPVDKYKLALWLADFAEEYSASAYMIACRLKDYTLSMPAESKNLPFIGDLYDIFCFAQGFLFSNKADRAERNLEEFRGQTWFVSEFIRDLVSGDSANSPVFLNVVKRLRSIHLNHIYICLFSEPSPLRGLGSADLKGNLLLAAYCGDTGEKAYPYSQMPALPLQDLIGNLPDLKSDTHLMGFSIFSGDVLYGFLLCEADPGKCSLLHVIGLQLGLLTNFLELERKEKIVGNELENIRERNEILNFLYEYDPLCNILNRRGFIERAIHMNRDNIGKKALCVFMDLDHLKEINDAFGHSKGDSALIAAGDILKKTVQHSGLAARIGGDEFVGLLIMDTPEDESIFRARLEQAFADYNSASGLPFYVEASVGIACFTCDFRLEISRIVNDADQLMYAEKKYKRPSVSRVQP